MALGKERKARVRDADLFSRQSIVQLVLPQPLKLVYQSCCTEGWINEDRPQKESSGKL